MFFFMRSPGDERYIDSGSVNCPRRGRDVEADLCAGCEWMTSVDLQAKPPFVRCRPAPVFPSRRVRG